MGDHRIDSLESTLGSGKQMLAIGQALTENLPRIDIFVPRQTVLKENDQPIRWRDGNEASLTGSLSIRLPGHSNSASNANTQRL